MQPISYRRLQFPPEIIRHTVWLYPRFALSYRDVEELLAERGLEISYETIALGPQIWIWFRPQPAPASAHRLRALGIWMRW
jgi:hypothetical protein